MPGPILPNGQAANPDLPEYKIYKIKSDGIGVPTEICREFPCSLAQVKGEPG